MLKMNRDFEVLPGGKITQQTEIPQWVRDHKFWGVTKFDSYLLKNLGVSREMREEAKQRAQAQHKIISSVSSLDAANWMGVMCDEMIKKHPFSKDGAPATIIDVIDGKKVHWNKCSGFADPMYKNAKVATAFGPIRAMKFRKLEAVARAKNYGDHIPVFATISTFEIESSDDKPLGAKFDDNLRLYAMFQLPLKDGKLDRNLDSHEPEETVTIVSVSSVPESIHTDIIRLAEMMGIHCKAPGLELVI